MVNPYDPQNPAKPDFFGGRKQVLQTVQERIEKAKIQRQSGGILVFGYRGVGKSSLLKKITSNVSAQPQMLVFYRRLSKTTSDSELYQLLVESLLDEIGQRKNPVEKMLGSISAAKLPVIELELRFDSEWESKTPYFKWRSLVKNIKNADAIVVEIDDADYLSPEALGELKTIVESDNNTPVVLIASGGIDFEERLVDDYSPIARIFSGASFNLGAFAPEETMEVLEKPLAKDDTRWAAGAIAKVHELSGGYPFLVQCIASASYVEHAEISVQRVVETLGAALKIGSSWLNHELETASDNDITYFVKIANSGKTMFKSSELSKLGISPPYIGRLVRLGVLKQISRGRYNLAKPPMIAHYHYLRRNMGEQEKKTI